MKLSITHLIDELLSTIGLLALLQNIDERCRIVGDGLERRNEGQSPDNNNNNNNNNHENKKAEETR